MKKRIKKVSKSKIENISLRLYNDGIIRKFKKELMIHSKSQIYNMEYNNIYNKIRLNKNLSPLLILNQNHSEINNKSFKQNSRNKFNNFNEESINKTNYSNNLLSKNDSNNYNEININNNNKTINNYNYINKSNSYYNVINNNNNYMNNNKLKIYQSAETMIDNYFYIKKKYK